MFAVGERKEPGFPLNIRPIPGRKDGCGDVVIEKKTRLPMMPVAEYFKKKHGDSGVPGQILRGFLEGQ